MKMAVFWLAAPQLFRAPFRIHHQDDDDAGSTDL
jgi:hypothetical protein